MKIHKKKYREGSNLFECGRRPNYVNYDRYGYFYWYKVTCKVCLRNKVDVSKEEKNSEQETSEVL